MKMVLSVHWNGRCRHYIINEAHGHVFIEHHCFKSLHDLIRYYSVNHVPITKNSGVFLMFPVPHQEWELRHDQVELGRIIGEGAYSGLFEGILTKGNKKVEVAVKVRKGKPLHKVEMSEICKEARIMRCYEHPNIVKFYGVAVDKEPMMVLMELISDGSLDSYLVKYGVDMEVHEKLTMCIDAACGLQYLHSMGCIHRDVAARNCLVKDRHVKLTDFGLSREISTTEENCRLSDMKQRLPVRWLAPETLKTACYTTRSDVFSFGVLMWEIFADAMEPYSDMTISEVNEQVKRGYRMPRPEGMPKDVGKVMRKGCFRTEPKKRWTLTSVGLELSKLHAKYANYSESEREQTLIYPEEREI
ncbi:hypothetical protein AB6A40_002985 [Gnathostoma spinigerum]|uniref:non-specific protein-tyrosine kinase n=1 Tax=Gnathostoma spinigerum TaxID=75299 RepID=A0ABD6EAQ7_9BILA